MRNLPRIDLYNTTSEDLLYILIKLFRMKIKKLARELNFYMEPSTYYNNDRYRTNIFCELYTKEVLEINMKRVFEAVSKSNDYV